MQTLCRTLLALAEQADAELTGPNQLHWLERLDAEHMAFRKALEACQADAQEGEVGLRLCAALARFWWMRGHAAEGLRWILHFLDQPTDDAGLWARVLEGGGALAYALSDYPRARQLCEQAAETYRQEGETRGEARMLNQLGMAAREQGDLATARSLHETSLEHYRALGDLWGEASCRNNLGVVAFLQGDQAEALSQHQASLELRRELGDARGIASSLGNLGHLAKLAQDLTQAGQCYRESLEIRQLLGDRWGVAAMRVNLGAVACELGDLEQAHGHLEQGLGLLHTVGDWVGICECLEAFSLLAEAEQDSERAVRLAAGTSALRGTLNAPLPAWKRPAWDALQTRLREQIGAERCQQAWTEGSGLTRDDLLRLAAAPGNKE